MRFEFDIAKNGANLAKHGVDMVLAEAFEFETAQIMIDDRHNYGETRTVAVGYITGRLHVMIYTMRGRTVRTISLRKANQKEQRRYHAQA